ncbi:MAG: protein translocase subunit SecF [Syntrophomonadaceae bacterium]|nr:protein translocase subunit SecF [Syntrophomonadaceae bacterium]
MQIIQKRKWFYILSLIIIIPGLVSLFIQGLNLGIDFKGGSILQIRMEEKVQSAEVRAVLQELNLDNAEVQKSGDEFFIRTVELDQEQFKELQDALKNKFANVEYLGSESVGAAIGSELTRNAILALVIATIAMLVYITFRFEWTFGVATVIPIIHNVLIVLGVFSIFQWEISSSFIAALLTVVGYTINDTIIIFDRVRENLRYKLKEDRMTLLNRSITQTLNRTINTVLSTTFPLIALLLFGGTNLKTFVIAMLIGFVSGAYSSICLASSLWYDIKNRA